MHNADKRLFRAELLLKPIHGFLLRIPPAIRLPDESGVCPPAVEIPRLTGENPTMLFIRDHRALIRFLEDLEGCTALAVDTEFVREGAYLPRLALIQIAAAGDRVAVIDPFAAAPLDDLFNRFRDRAVEKVFHSSHQDLEILFTRMGEVPAPVFDTQVAAAFLGYGEHIGLAHLLKAELGVELDKSETYTNWLQRPLSQAQLSYAADDVRCLLALAAKLKTALEERGRLSWVAEVLQSLTASDRYGTDPREAYRQVRRAGSLDRRELAVLRELAAWRENEAERHDRPRRAIATDECLIELTRRQYVRPDLVVRTRGLGRHYRRDSVEPVIEAIKRGRDVSEAALPEAIVVAEPDPAAQIAGDLVLSIIRARAQAVGIAPSYFTTAEDVRGMVASYREGSARPDIPMLKDWRYDQVGRDIEGLLSGATVVGLAGGTVELLERTKV